MESVISEGGPTSPGGSDLQVETRRTAEVSQVKKGGEIWPCMHLSSALATQFLYSKVISENASTPGAL